MISDDLVRYLRDGTCVIDASQAGNARFAPALAKAHILVGTGPRFVHASPARTAKAGKAYAYHFAASGYPALGYALSGAPSWLKINGRTGLVSGTVPAGTKSFSYTVTAANQIGRASARFTVKV